MPPLVGRDREIAMVKRALAEPRAIVVVRGPPGVGKSALARQAAPDATLLSFDRPEGPTVDDAKRANGIVILDGVDNALPQATARAEEQARGGGRAIVTSCAPLGIQGETVIDIGPLSPDESVELLRAAAERAGAKLDDGDTLKDIALRLDGLPLFLHIAARRAASMPARVLAKRLDEDLIGSLVGGPKDGPPHQRSAFTTLARALALLTETQRRALAQLSLFRGGFTPEAAEHVVVLAGTGDTIPDGVEPRASPVVDVLAELCERSMILLDRGERYRMLEVIRVAAGKLLAKEDARAAANRHARTFARLAAQVSARGGAERIYEEGANFLAVAERIELGKVDATDDVTEAILAYEAAASRPAALAPFLQAVLSLPQPEDARLAVRLHLARLNVLRQLGRIDDARRELALAEAGVRTLGDERMSALVALRRATLLTDAGELDEAEQILVAALKAARAAKDDYRVTIGSIAYASIMLERGDTKRALGIARDGAAAAHAVGNVVLEAVGHFLIGVARFMDGEHDDAIAKLRSAASTCARAGDSYRQAIGLAFLAAAVAKTGDVEEAERALATAGPLAQDDAMRAIVGTGFGHVALARARAAMSARDGQTFREEIRLAKSLASSPISAPWQARMAKALLSRAISAEEESNAAQRASAAPLSAASPEALVVDVRFAWFRPPHRDVIAFERRALLQRLFRKLVRARVDRPGQPLAKDALILAGWPDEKLARDAALNRLGVALTGLRKLGLDGLLLTVDGGLLLDARVPFMWCDENSDGDPPTDPPTPAPRR